MSLISYISKLNCASLSKFRNGKIRCFRLDEQLAQGHFFTSEHRPHVWRAWNAVAIKCWNETFLMLGSNMLKYIVKVRIGQLWNGRVTLNTLWNLSRHYFVMLLELFNRASGRNHNYKSVQNHPMYSKGICDLMESLWVIPRQVSRSRNPTPSDLAQILHTCLYDQNGKFWKCLDP